MRPVGVELRTVRMPLRSAFRTSFGSETVREVLLVRWVCEEAEGWGECVAGREPLYSSEYVAGAVGVMRSHLLPRLFSADGINAEGVADALAAVSGHRMSKSALEMAVLDAQLRARNESLGSYLGVARSSVPAGVSVGIHDLARAHGVAVWCGGMLETGLGRRANIALAALPGFTLSGDTSASDRFYTRDLTDPVVLEDGHVAVPTDPGLGAVPDEDALREFTVASEWIPA
jgi:O-succinylbenzoate synthase